MKRKLLFLLLTVFIATSYTYGQYCAASGGGDEYISGVEIGSISNTGTGADGYHDYTALSTDLYQGQSGASISITNGTSYGSDDVGVWIDWNQDSDFDDVDENVVCDADGGGQGTFTFDVPAGATLGNTVMRVRIKYSGSDCGSPCGTTTYGEVEDYTINVTTPPSCPAPSAQTESNITSTSADLGWTENGSATTWDIEIVPAGASPTGTPTATGVTSNPYTYGNLNVYATYDWYVRADCGGGSASTWTGPSTFTTACATVSTLSEDFTSSSTPYCWTNDGDESWLFSTGAGYGAASAGDHTPGGGTNYAWIDGSGGVGTNELLTPYIDLSGFTTPAFEFYYFSNNTDNPGDDNTLTVDFWDGAVWNTLLSYSGDDPSWQQGLYDLSGYTITGDAQFRFVVTGTASTTYYNDILIDDVNVLEYPSCLAPTAQIESNIAMTSTDLGWTENGSATTWNIEWGSTGFSQGTGTTVSGVASNPYTLSGLTANTTYDWYVQADCGGGSTSSWTGPSTFTTLPGAHSFPLTEDFESGFTYFDNAYGNDVDFADETTLFHGGAHSVHNTYTSNNINILHETGILDLSSTSAALLEFWHIAKTEGGWDKCYVEISTDGGASYTALPASTYQGSGSGYGSAGYFDEDDYTEWGTDSESPDNTWWKKETFSLSSYNVANVRFRFKLTSDGSAERDGWYIDDIHIYEPSCPAPSAQATDSIKLNAAQLSWTETGSATEWNVRIGISGYDTTSTSYTVVTNDTLTVDTLLASTTYDWYVRASCGGGDYSSWIGPHSFTTSSGLATGPYPADGASGVLVNSDTLKWNPVAGATKYVLKVGTTSGDDDVLTSSTTDTAYITGSDWDYSTQYFWSVNTVYNGTNDTVTGTEWDFSTECGIYTPTYSQGFTSYIPLCWSEAEGFLTANSTLTGTSSYWTQDDFANVAINGKSAKLNIYGTTRKEWLISPSIDLSGDSYQLEFDLALTHFGTTNADTLGADDTLAVIISTDNGATWSTSNILQVWTAATIISNTGEHVTIDLSAYTSLTKFAFYGASSVSNKDNDVFIDNFTVQIPPTCPAPSAQATDSLKLNSAQLSWTENGSATEWNIRIGTTGYDTTGASFSVVTNDTITVDTLLASTTYDWYVRATCGVGDYSSWIGPQTFTTSSGLATGPYPANGASKVFVNSDTLKWNPVAGATKYVLNVGTTSGGGDVLSGYSTTDTTYIKGSNWDYTTQYFWSVNTVYNGINDTVTGTEWDFTTECDATTVPYFEDFDAVTAPDFPGCMTVENTNGDAYKWETSADGLSSPNAAKIRYNSGAAMDDWFFTNGLQLTGGVTYEVQFVYRAASSNFPEKLAVDWGTAASSTAMSGNPIFDNTNVTNTSWYIGSGSFTPSATGNYYVGFHGHSDADEFYLYVDDIQVAEQQTTATWNGTASNEWDEPGNWSPGVPTSNTDITIPTTAANYPTLSHARQCNTITIQSDATGDASILNDGLLVLSGDATIQRYLTAGVWHDFSPSAANQTLNAMYFNHSPDVWLTKYNEPDNSRTYLIPVTDTMPVGSGYEILVGGSNAVTVNFIGAMNRSDVALTSASTPPLSYTGADPLGYNLIGNPFASPLALDSGAWNMANVDSTFWLWDGAIYKDYNTTTKAGSMTGGIIPMGQGFFIHANAASPTITIPVAARVHSGQAYYKNTNAAGSSLEVMSLRATYNTNKYDELNIAFLNGAQDEFENHDTRKMFAFDGTAPQVYATIPDEEVSLNSLPVLAPGEEKTVEVGYKAGTNGQQILVADISKLEDIDVVLEDLKINKIQNLNDNPIYKFDATTYQDPDRFRIHFNRSVTGIDNNEASTAVKAYAYNKILYVVSKGDMVNQTKNLDVYDILGRKVLSKKIPGGEVISIPVTVSDAYVVVRIISAGEVYTTKVYIK